MASATYTQVPHYHSHTTLRPSVTPQPPHTCGTRIALSHTRSPGLGGWVAQSLTIGIFPMIQPLKLQRPQKETPISSMGRWKPEAQLRKGAPQTQQQGHSRAVGACLPGCQESWPFPLPTFSSWAGSSFKENLGDLLVPLAAPLLSWGPGTERGDGGGLPHPIWGPTRAYRGSESLTPAACFYSRFSATRQLPSSNTTSPCLIEGLTQLQTALSLPPFLPASPSPSLSLSLSLTCRHSTLLLPSLSPCLLWKLLPSHLHVLKEWEREVGSDHCPHLCPCGPSEPGLPQRTDDRKRPSC